MPTDPIRPPSPARGSPEPAPASATGPPGAPDFAALLREQFEEPRQRIQDVRAAHAAAAVEGAATSKLLALRQVASNGPDPHGWRSMTREAGDRLVGAGFGSLFERQIDQESGFAPDVVFGRRRSSAGAEGVAQLMPEYYPSVDRPDPQESLIAAAQTMRHYLEVWDGDARKALASYNAGLGRVRSLVEARGADWERRLPEETKHYLANLVRPGELTYVLPPRAGGEVAVFGGRGPGGVLTSPLDRVGGQRATGSWPQLAGVPGALVRAPAEGRVASVGPVGNASGVTIDHGNGWRTILQGLAGVQVSVGQALGRSEPLGRLAAGRGGEGLLGLAVTLDGRALDPTRHVLRTRPEARSRGRC